MSTSYLYFVARQTKNNISLRKLSCFNIALCAYKNH